jgi:hypothetical protein
MQREHCCLGQRVERLLTSLWQPCIQHHHIFMLKSLVLTNPSRLPVNCYFGIRHLWSSRVTSFACREMTQLCFGIAGGQAVSYLFVHYNLMLKQYVSLRAYSSCISKWERAERYRLPGEVAVAFEMSILVYLNVKNGLEIPASKNYQITMSVQKRVTVKFLRSDALFHGNSLQ